MDPDGEGRREAELGIVRLKLESGPADELLLEAHGVVSVTSPASPGTASIAVGSTRRLLGLSYDAVDEADARATAEVDRLSVTWQRPAFRLVAGRQGITWGVNNFWPALDLFAPFPPERTDREYKPGVDALRLTVPLGGLSELEVVAAGQGTSLAEDGSVGALTRVHLGAADLGVMAGWFHRDVVVGGFVAASVRGTGLRAEAAYTDSGDPEDARLGRAGFWRAGLGLDRQLTPTVSLTAEIAWSGFGASGAERYPRVALSDRVRRGEVSALGRSYVGGSLAWQAHPLVSVTGVVLANAGDGSLLLLPHLDWSLADDLALVLGGVFGFGPGRRSGGAPGSEYGAVADVLYVALKAYF